MRIIFELHGFSNGRIGPSDKIMKVSSHAYSAVTVGTHLVARNVGYHGCFGNPTLAMTAVSAVVVPIVHCQSLLRAHYADVAVPVPSFTAMLIARLFRTTSDSIQPSPFIIYNRFLQLGHLSSLG